MSLLPAEIQRLQARLQQPLPGITAQWQMSRRQFDLAEIQRWYAQLPDNHRKASVMALIYPKNEQWHTALMQRPESPYAHSRQVSFPGGGQEKSDDSDRTTALRETHEEFGVPPSLVQVLGALSPIYIPVSNFFVQPFVGFIPQAPVFSHDPNEVEEILETPLDWLLDLERRKICSMSLTNDEELRDVPYFDMHQRKVWGATAMILAELATILQEADFLPR